MHSRGSPAPLDERAEAWSEQRDAICFVLDRTERELCLEDGRGLLTKTIADVGAGPQQVAEQLHLVDRARQLVPELEEWGKRDRGRQRPVEPGADGEHVPARCRDGARSVEVAGPQAPHLPAVQLKARAAERQIQRRVGERTIADDVLTAAAQVVGAASRVDERPAEILAAAERTLDAEPGAHLSAG